MSAHPGLLIIWTDGAARGNPGPAGIGAYLTDSEGTMVAEIGEGIGDTTNNVAEYSAAIAGVTRAGELGATEVLLRCDSELLIKQLKGEYRVKTPHLQSLHRELRTLLGRFAKYEVEHVRRELNKEADRLANQGVDEMLAARRRA